MGERTYNKFMAEIQDTLCNGMMDEDELREEVLRLNDVIEALEAKLAALVEAAKTASCYLEQPHFDELVTAIAAAEGKP